MAGAALSGGYGDDADLFATLGDTNHCYLFVTIDFSHNGQNCKTKSFLPLWP